MNNKNCFDFLRFFFAVNILLSHLSELSQNESLYFLSKLTNATLCVKGFFIVSGFLVTKSYVNTPSLKQYFIKRSKRILPAYIVVIILSTLTLSITSKYEIVDYFWNLNTYKYLGWNLIFLNFMHPCLPGVFENNLLCAVNGALWTLKVEESFYIFLPFIFYLIRKTKKAATILLLMYFLSLLYWYVMDDLLNQPLFAKQMPGYISFFAVGIFLNLNLEWVLKFKKLLFLGALISLLMTYFFYLQINVLFPGALGLLIIIVAYSFPFFNNFGKYGDFTYGLYIYHFPVIQLFRQYDLFNRYNAIAMSVVVIIITFLFAAFSWFYIERGFLDRFKKK